MTNSSALYTDIELSTEVMSASGHRLIQMLLEKCLQQINVAKSAIENKNIAKRNQAISRANDIVTYLAMCLNFQDEQTREIASLLATNYSIVEKCLLNAMLKNDIGYLDIGHTVIANIKEGWDQIGNQTENK